MTARPPTPADFEKLGVFYLGVRTTPPPGSRETDGGPR